jgi:hypothetical protein
MDVHLIRTARASQPKATKSIHSTAAVMRNRTWQSEAGCEPTDCDRYDYHWQRLMLADLDVGHREMLGLSCSPHLK